MTPTNKLTVYSSGMADFVRAYPIKPGARTTISITVKEEFLSDILDSLRVFGPVRVVEPASFTSDGTHQKTLTINPAQAEKDLFTKLSGSEVCLIIGGAPEPVTGRLIGMDERERVHPSGEVSRQPVVSIWSNNKQTKYNADTIRSMEVLGDGPQAEVRKALDANAQGIKQGSTKVTLTVEPLDGELTEDGYVYVQYMVPMAAPKYTYRLSQVEEKTTLELLAILDNNSDEDLNRFIVTVATGQPISFTTDLATIRTPRRSRVNVVNDTALGAVDVEEGYDGEELEALSSGGLERGFSEGADFGGSAKSSRAVLRSQTVSRRTTTPDVMMEAIGAIVMPDQAQMARAQSSEVGDFQLFTCDEPISIAARSSALIPLTTQEVAGETILIYKIKDHKTRPFRAVQFKNQTELSLTKGVCSIFLDGTNAGKGILTDSVPGDTPLIPYQLETGVSIAFEQSPSEEKLSRIGVAQGSFVQETWVTVLSRYVVKSKRDEKFRLRLEYPACLGGNSFVTVSNTAQKNAKLEKTPSGWRVAMSMEPKESFTVEVRERRIDTRTVVLDASNFTSYLNPLAKTIPGIDMSQEIQDCLRIRYEIVKVRERTQQASNKKTILVETAQRMSGYLSSLSEKTAGNHSDEWITTIKDAEKEIQTINEKTLPDLQAELDSLTEKLTKAIQKITLDWGTKVPEPATV